MAKLYFRYGAMGSAKTLNLLAVAHNYMLQGKKVLLVKPRFDVRFGHDEIRSRAGLEKKADILVDEETDLLRQDLSEASCILVDEAQFLSPCHIDQLRKISHEKDIPVICYGLRTDFRTKLFQGGKRLMEIADAIEEVKTTCTYCNKKATMNLKHMDGKATLSGASIDLGAEEKYVGACYGCYISQLQKAGFLNPEPSSLSQ